MSKGISWSVFAGGSWSPTNRLNIPRRGACTSRSYTGLGTARWSPITMIVVSFRYPRLRAWEMNSAMRSALQVTMPSKSTPPRWRQAGPRKPKGLCVLRSAA